MESPSPAPLTSAQLAAISAGEGHARFIDPSTQFVYHLIAQGEAPTIADDYVREKLAEAQADVERGEVADWDIAAIKQELHARLSRETPRG